MRSCSPARLAVIARALRATPTTTEAILWQALRGGRLGAAFRRQVPLGGYIVDFCARREKLIVEVDGGYHAGRGRADAQRQRALEGLGYRVLRLPVELVKNHLAEALALVVAAREA